ncbi:PSP1 domain-containing protein [Marinifilum flexuosum]|uniref:Cell fate regulator YaaT (PSP1 superfamily) n=1 Tax=Marinifilum flexuosum TaxID=1117708 RepID=A0A419WXN1_9BACT|nr:regulatory iron-sulfur-containing complex subunit RicT [Marinifilum flexuosum]RKE00214.1 cell fate regulator YaaT (PSP1 superfamily) [Marinifilum flexuosum]
MTENKEPKGKCAGCASNKRDHRLLAGKLDVYDWLKDVPESAQCPDVVEIKFKNTRKGFYSNTNQLRLQRGDVIAVEASPGHDIGIVSLTGDLVVEQMRKQKLDPNTYEAKKVYRKAKPVDIEKWHEAIALEHKTMIKARQISAELKLDMKIGDVEYQGDKTKAIFYYIADDRVDFRQLIKVLAEQFKIRIEMRQIGARQEAGRIGGIGPCGRELCCSTWITNFVSVTTNAARYQEISLNPQKLAGQCGKLKCCLNFELDCYIDAQKDFPNTSIPLETKDGTAYHQKTDIFKRQMWYSFDKFNSMNMVQVSVDRVKEIIRLNKKGTKVDKLISEKSIDNKKSLDYENVVGQDSLNRFDKKENPNKRRGKRKFRRKPRKPNKPTKS